MLSFYLVAITEEPKIFYIKEDNSRFHIILYYKMTSIKMIHTIVVH